MLRFLTATLATIPGEWILDGSPRLRQRTVAPLVEALRGLGAQVRYLRDQGFAPLAIRGTGLDGGVVELDASLSSQFASAILMAATQARNTVVLDVRSLVSEPYIELTVQSLAHFGATVEHLSEAGRFRIGPVRLEAEHLEIEADYSAAAYGAAAAVLTGGRIVLEGLSPSSAQGDRRFLDVLEAMGARVRWQQSELIVSGGDHLVGVERELADIPDQVPTLAALAPFARGRTVISNVAHLRIKESDRLAAMATELGRLGASVRERPDGLVVEGSWSDRPPPELTTKVRTYGDHRIAMSLAICGLRRPGVVVDEPTVVRKSYPQFWDHLGALLSA